MNKKMKVLLLVAGALLAGGGAVQTLQASPGDGRSDLSIGFCASSKGLCGITRKGTKLRGYWVEIEVNRSALIPNVLEPNVP